MCGVEIFHKIHQEVRVPPICYNLQRDLAQYAILWLNSHYIKKGEKWYRVEADKEKVIPIGIDVDKDKEVEPSTQMLDYSKVYFIK